MHLPKLRRCRALILLASACTLTSVVVAPTTSAAATTAKPAAQSAAAKTQVKGTPKGDVVRTTKNAKGKTVKTLKAACAVPNDAKHASVNGQAVCEAQPASDGQGNPLAGSTPPSTALTPAQLQDAYNLPSGANGAGETVAIVDAFGYTTLESDLGQFRSFYGLPACTEANGCLSIVDQNGGNNLPPDGTGTGWPTETALDVDAVSSVCPLCHITVVQGNSNSFVDLATAANTAASLPGVVAISNSYSSGDSDNDPVDFTALDPDYTHPGIAVTAATGDDGGNAPAWPATNPNVVAVGGTELIADSSPRGWNEVVWNELSNGHGAANSGCSTFEPKPEYQADINTSCDNRAVADMSADADPFSGIALFNSGEQGGFAQFGGTSLSTPLTAGMFALAGGLAAGTNAASLPYTDPAQASDFNDVTVGNNLAFPPCPGALCTAGPGWDGPTGIGTPNGVEGLTDAASGFITGTVTGPSGPLAGATVTATGADASTATAITADDGSYTLHLADGTYDVSASAFGFTTQHVSGVEVNTGATVTENFTLAAVPTRVVSGTVTDASGQGWPMYAKITVDGMPGAFFTKPATGRYSVRLPQDASYTFHVSSASLSGYLDTTQTVTVAEGPVTQNIGLSVDSTTCTAPGYTVNFGDGSGSNFEGWSGTTPKDGWTIANNNPGSATWGFTDLGNRGNLTHGGTGNFAVVDSDHAGPGQSQDTSLVSPTMDFSNDASPSVSFDTYYQGFVNQQGTVDVSTDGGQNWTTVDTLAPANNPFIIVAGPQEIDLPMAANQADVQVRFHFTASFGWWWELDNIIIDGNLPPGTQNCVASDNGALVEGLVTDNNTSLPLNGAQVSITGDANAVPGVSAATPDDAALADGFYEMFIPSADINANGRVPLAIQDGKYDPASVNLAVVPGAANAKNWVLKAGHLTESSTGLSVTEQLGASKSKALTFTNDGTDPVNVKLSEQGSSFTPLLKSAESVPDIRIPVSGTPDKPLGSTGAKNSATGDTSGVQPADAPWTPITNEPENLMDEAAVTVNGIVYEFGGVSNGADQNTTFAYDPSTGTWTKKANVPETVEKPNAEVVNGMVYVFGGADFSGTIDSAVYRYDPTTDTWTQMTSMPTAEWAAGSAVVNNLIYVVGGSGGGPSLTTVQVYDPSTDTWSTAADYPEAVFFQECQGLAGKVVCAGGVNASTAAETASTYSYDPGTNTWTKGADMPFTQWGGVSAGANGMLQIAQGFSHQAIINSAEQYNPASDTWSALPNANVAVARGGGACGFYSLGGTNVGGAFTGTADAEQLPGFDQCGIVDNPWLSENTDQFTVPVGATVTITVSMDSSQVSQPGTYTGGLSIQTDSPYSLPAVTTTMVVTPPASWGKITGTVTSAADGSPIAGATIQICTQYVAQTGLCGPQSFTLKTVPDGSYQLWLSHGFSPLQLIAAKDGFQPQVKVVKLPKGAIVTTNFALKKD